MRRNRILAILAGLVLAVGALLGGASVAQARTAPRPVCGLRWVQVNLDGVAPNDRQSAEYAVQALRVMTGQAVSVVSGASEASDGPGIVVETGQTPPRGRSALRTLPTSRGAPSGAPD